MDSIISRLFVKRQYINNGSPRRPSKEGKSWESELHRDRLTVSEYEVLLGLPYWEVAFIPFILIGLRIFSISQGDSEGEEPYEPPSSYLVLPILDKILEAIRQGVLLPERTECFVSISLAEAIVHPVHAIYEKIRDDFCYNSNKFAIKIRIDKIIEWSLLQDIQISQELLDVLGLSQESPAERLKEELTEGGRKYFLKIVKEPEITIPQGNEIEALAAAQMLWFYNQNKTKSQIAKDPMLRGFGPPNGYGGKSGNFLKKLGLIDPCEKKRGPGRRSKSKRTEFVLLPIQGIFMQYHHSRKFDLKKSRIAFRAFIRMLKKIKIEIQIEEIWSHPVIEFYFSGPHPLIQKVFRGWLDEIIVSLAYPKSNESWWEKIEAMTARSRFLNDSRLP